MLPAYRLIFFRKTINIDVGHICFQKLLEVSHKMYKRAYRHVRNPLSNNFDQMGITKETNELKTKRSSIGRVSGGGGGGGGSSSSSNNKSKVFSRMEETCLIYKYHNSPKLLCS